MHARYKICLSSIFPYDITELQGACGPCPVDSESVGREVPGI